MDGSKMEELAEIKAAMGNVTEGSANFENLTFSGKMVERFLNDNTEVSIRYGREKEREELVCRLIAGGMSVEDISLILNIRLDAVRIIESNNAKILIPEYAKTLKSRRKYREKQGK